MIIFVSLFVPFFVWGFTSLKEGRNFPLTWKRHHDRCRASKWTWTLSCEGSPHLLWNWASVCSGHLWWPVKLSGMTVELSLSVFTTKVFRRWDWNTQPSRCEANTLTDRANAVFILIWSKSNKMCNWIIWYLEGRCSFKI